MMDDKGRKARYINDLLKVFKTFFNYLKKEGHIKESPTANVKNMKQPKVKIITFTEEEIRKLLNHFSGRTFLSIRNRAMIRFRYESPREEKPTLKPMQRPMANLSTAWSIAFSGMHWASPRRNGKRPAMTTGVYKTDDGGGFSWLTTG